MILRVVASAAVLFALLFAWPARAHVEKTAFLEIVETAPDRATAILRLPTPSRELTVRFARCRAAETEASGRSQRVVELHLECPEGLHGETVTVEGMGLTVTATVARFLFADGATSSQLLTPEHPAYTVPRAAASFGAAFARFVRLGVEHILGGYDHLLFLLGLVALARGARRLLFAATAFTVAHSLTLAATVTGALHVPSALAEACIAVSLVLVALDAARENRRESIALTFVFGLAHGLGFAGALSEIGLPEGEIPAALFGFNVGVELGQLAFLTACMLAAAIIVRIFPRHRERLGRIAPLGAAYVVGCVGAYLAIARVAQALS